MSINENRVLIMGTSNSIKRTGYFKYLSNNSRYERLSIGDTTSLSGVYNLLKNENLLNQFKYCVLDFWVNESTFILCENYPIEWCISSYAFCLKKLIENNVIPITLVIPRKDFLWLEDLQTSLAKELKLPVINAVDYINKYEFDSYIGDSVHLTTKVQQTLASAIDSKITELDNANEPFDMSLPEWLRKFNFYNISCVKEEYLRDTRITNSLIDINCIKLESGKKYLFKNNNFLAAIVYISDDYTPYCKFSECANNKSHVIKNLHHKNPKPLLTVRSIGYTSAIQIKSDFEVYLMKTIDSRKEELCHNTTPNKTDSPHLLLEDFLFTNLNIKSFGQEIIERLGLKELMARYQFWHLSKVLKEKDEKKIKQVYSLIENSPKLFTEHLFYLKSKNVNINVVSYIADNYENLNYYDFLLLGKFFSKNKIDSIYCFEHALQYCHSAEILFEYAKTLIKYRDLSNALIQIKKAIYSITLSYELDNSQKSYFETYDQINKLLTDSSESRGVIETVSFENFPDFGFSNENIQQIRKKLQSKPSYLNTELSTKNIKKLKITQFSNKNHGCFSVKVNNVSFVTLLVPNPQANSIVFSFASGSRKKSDDCCFTRNSYYHYFKDAIYICIDDPSYEMDPSFDTTKPTWFYGINGISILEELIIYIKKLISCFNVPINKVTFLGSSAGGYIATYLGTMFNGSNCIAMSPQLVPKYWPDAEYFENKTGVDLSDFNKRENFLSPFILKSSSKFFILINQASKVDVEQINTLTDINKVQYGISQIKPNIYIWKHFTVGNNLHNCNPEQFGISLARFILQNNFFISQGFTNFSQLLSNEHATKTFYIRELSKQVK